MDAIQIKDLEVFCHHGVLREENILGQKFLVSLTLYMDVSKAGKTDELSYSVNYAEISHFVKKEMESTDYKLIEAVSEHLAEAVLMKFPAINSINVEIKKPWAPILLPLDTVSVSIKRGWHRAYLSVGSNMGDRKAYLDYALQMLENSAYLRNVRASSWIETEPYGYVKQDKFLNGVIEIETLWNPHELLRYIGEIEENGGRERLIHWGPRTIDLDIILYEDCVIQTKDLVVPHREMHKREYVLEPLCEIAPWVKHPVYHKTAEELLLLLKKGE